jgi:hypothetical protein
MGMSSDKYENKSSKLIGRLEEKVSGFDNYSKA